MLNLFPHIAYLISKHECLTLPGFGALMVYRSESEKAQEEGIFAPPSPTLGFNPELKHNDGLLSGLLMRDRKISYSESNLLVYQFFNEFEKHLNLKKRMEIPMIGIFSISHDNKVLFHPLNGYTSSDAYLFGFCNFHIPLLTENEEIHPVQTDLSVTNSSNKDILWVPVSRKRIKSVGTIVAAALGMLVISTSFDNQSVPNQYASVLTTFLSEKKTETEKQRSVSYATSPPIETSIIKQDILNHQTKSTEHVGSALNTYHQTTNPKSLYYIIVGSFPKRNEAEKKLSIIRSELSNQADIIETTNSQRSRIYIASFEKKIDAEVFVNDLRQTNPKYKDAWVLSQRVKDKK